MDDKDVEIGTRIVALNTGEKGAISRLCKDKGVVYIRWDRDNSQEMVEISAIEKEAED